MPSTFTQQAVLLVLVISLLVYYHLYIHVYILLVLASEPRASHVPVNPGTDPSMSPAYCLLQSVKGICSENMSFDDFVLL